MDVETWSSTSSVPPSPSPPPEALPPMVVVMLVSGGLVILFLSFRACYYIRRDWFLHRGSYRVEDSETDRLDYTTSQLDRAAAEFPHQGPNPRVVPPRSRLGEPRSLSQTVASYLARQHLNQA